VGLGRRAGHVVEIEPLRMGVQFQELAVVAGCSHHGVEVDLVGFRAKSMRPVGWARPRRRVLQGVEHAAGDLVARLLLAEMDAGHDPIGLGEHVVGQVEPAVSRMSTSTPLSTVMRRAAC